MTPVDKSTLYNNEFRHTTLASNTTHAHTHTHIDTHAYTHTHTHTHTYIHTHTHTFIPTAGLPFDLLPTCLNTNVSHAYIINN